MENFVAFSVGPRLCLGRKFSTVESVCFLSNSLQKWKFDVKLDKQETRAQWQESVLHLIITVTLRNGAWYSVLYLHLIAMSPSNWLYRKNPFASNQAV
jgi:hypothetical protein